MPRLAFVASGEDSERGAVCRGRGARSGRTNRRGTARATRITHDDGDDGCACTAKACLQGAGTRLQEAETPRGVPSPRFVSGRVRPRAQSAARVVEELGAAFLRAALGRQSLARLDGRAVTGLKQLDVVPAEANRHGLLPRANSSCTAVSAKRLRTCGLAAQSGGGEVLFCSTARICPSIADAGGGDARSGRRPLPEPRARTQAYVR